jgi:hypothetical protein
MARGARDDGPVERRWVRTHYVFQHTCPGSPKATGAPLVGCVRSRVAVACASAARSVAVACAMAALLVMALPMPPYSRPIATL